MLLKSLKLDPKWPVGVFDSGLGGLTVVSAIQKLLPGEDLIYVADNEYLPYGDRSKHEIITRGESIARLLAAYPVKAIVIACNTATAAAINTLREKFNIPIIGVEPGIKPACEISQTGNIGVLATAGTLESEKYENLRNLHGKNVTVFEQACQGLVQAIENEYPDFDETRKLLKLYLDTFKNNQVDSIVLGCTHYPLIEKLIHDEMHTVVTINTGTAIARQLNKRLKESQLLNTIVNESSLSILGSRADQAFQDKVSRLLDASNISAGRVIQLPAYCC